MQLLLNQKEESLSIFPSIALDQSLPSYIYLWDQLQQAVVGIEAWWDESTRFGGSTLC
jgi:hypothetical protein